MTASSTVSSQRKTRGGRTPHHPGTQLHEGSILLGADHQALVDGVLARHHGPRGALPRQARGLLELLGIVLTVAGGLTRQLEPGSIHMYIYVYMYILYIYMYYVCIYIYIYVYVCIYIYAYIQYNIIELCHAKKMASMQK